MTQLLEPWAATRGGATARHRRPSTVSEADSPYLVVGRDCDPLLCVPAATANRDAVAFLVRHGSGVVRVALPDADCDRLALHRMVPAAVGAGARHRVAVDLVDGVTTGISATDRAATIRALANPRSVAADFARPGHIIPISSDDLGRDDPLRVAAARAARVSGHPAVAFCELVSLVRPEHIATAAEALAFGAETDTECVPVDGVRPRLTWTPWGLWAGLRRLS